MKKLWSLAGLFVIVLSVVSPIYANPVSVPEIDGSFAVSALGLLSGVLMVWKGRR